VQHINPSEVLGVIDTTGDVKDHTFITAMGLLRVGYDTLVGSGEGDSLKEKFNRLLKI
jgi:cell division protein FtsA